MGNFIIYKNQLSNLFQNCYSFRIETDKSVNITSSGVKWVKYLVLALHNDININNLCFGIIYGSTSYQGLKFKILYQTGENFSAKNGEKNTSLIFSSKFTQTDVNIIPMGPNQNWLSVVESN